jgi:hypothetical protein
VRINCCSCRNEKDGHEEPLSINGGKQKRTPCACACPFEVRITVQFIFLTKLFSSLLGKLASRYARLQNELVVFWGLLEDVGLLGLF